MNRLIINLITLEIGVGFYFFLEIPDGLMFDKPVLLKSIPIA